MRRNPSAWAAIGAASLVCLWGCGSSSRDQQSATQADRQPASQQQASAQQTAGTVTLPEGTTLVVSLDTPLSTASNHVGDTFVAHVSEPVQQGGEVVVPAGATVQGKVAGVGDGSETSMTLAFPAMEANGLTRPIDVLPVQLIAKPDGGADAVKILGGGAASTVLGAATDEAQAAAPGGELGTAAGTVNVLVQGSSVDLPRGQRIALKLASPAEVPASG